MGAIEKVGGAINFGARGWYGKPPPQAPKTPLSSLNLEYSAQVKAATIHKILSTEHTRRFH